MMINATSKAAKILMKVLGIQRASIRAEERKDATASAFIWSPPLTSVNAPSRSDKDTRPLLYLPRCLILPRVDRQWIRRARRA
jgi:hypothetical protein